MLRTGPIPLFIHGIVEYVAALAFLLAPFVLNFESSSATHLAVAVGVAVIFVAATTEGPTSLINVVPIVVHVVVDYALAIALVATPFVFGFSDEIAPTAWFMALGVMHLLITIGTRFVSEAEVPGVSGGESQSDSGEGQGGEGGEGEATLDVGALARGTSVDIEAGEHTVLDD